MNSKLIICPNNTKMKILEELSKKKELHNNKFMTKEEFFNNYFFNYNDDAIYYLMTKHHYHIDVCKEYLNNLKVIDINKNYKSKKLELLQDLKKELLDNNLLIDNKAFKNTLSNYQIEVKNYYDLDKYEEEVLNIHNNYSLTKVNKDIYEFNNIEGEVNFVALKIIELLNKGVDINKIYLCNLSNDYNYIVERVFKYYNIPLNIDNKNTIFSTTLVNNYLKDKELDLEDSSKSIINKKIINILKDLNNIDSSSKEYEILLKDKLRNTYLPIKILDKAINIKNIYDEEFNEEEHIFILGFNSNFLSLETDTSFITDKDKEEVSLFNTYELNKRRKYALSNILSSIKNLTLSYSLNSPFNTYYKSPLIEEYNLSIKTIDIDEYNHSNIYNKLRLGEYLDKFYIYGEKEKNIDSLNATYDIPYRNYDNSFKSININTYQKNLPYPLNLSYTSLNTYNECNFKYYIRYVLRLEPYEDKFTTFIGSMYHEILSVYNKENFNFEEVYREYINNRELSLKEKLLLVKIKEDLVLLIDKLNEQKKYTNYTEELHEKKLTVPLKKEVAVNIIGYIDKIMYYKEIEDMYFSIIDYKTGTIDTHIEPMKYGLHMQLPVYLYLIHYSKAFTSPIFTGIYYQNILFNYPKYSSDIEKEEETKYYLQGYSISNVDILSRFDKTFEESKLIKSMKYNDDKFGPYTKTIDEEEVYNLVKYTEKVIDKNVDDIISAKFSINPKVLNGKNISCEYCNFKDLCYTKDDDIKYLDKVEDLSFLGGEE